MGLVKLRTPNEVSRSDGICLKAENTFQKSQYDCELTLRL